MTKTEWVDFKMIKEAVSMEMVLDHYSVSGHKQVGDDFRGPCPIHNGAPSSKHLSVNPAKNAFKCFSSSCGARGNILDFVAAMEKCSVRDAALKLKDWFKVGDSDDSETESDNIISLNSIESLKGLVEELEVYSSQISQLALLVAEKTTAVKEIVTRLEKGE